MYSGRARHLVILAHIWACVPFLLAWTFLPSLRGENRLNVIGPMSVFGVVAVAYLLVRTYIAWRDPPWLRWEYVFPGVDVVLISIAIHLRHDPESVLNYGYFLPIAEAVGTLDVRWAASVGLMTLVGAIVATWGQHHQHEPLAVIFRLVFLVIMASLLTWLARLAAGLRAQLEVATDRNRIAVEMHDGVQAQLIVIASQLELARCVALTDGARAAQLAADSRDLARRAADDLRFLVHRLRAPQPAQAFLPALRQYIHNLSARTSLPITIKVTSQPYPLGPEAEHTLFHVVQESLNNTLKHAHATEASVTLDFYSEEVHCSVSDDGVGFDPGARSQGEGGHVGLESGEEQARQQGGCLQVESAPGKGTKVTVILPRLSSRKRGQSGGNN